MIDLTTGLPLNFLITFLVLTLAIFLRYLFLAGLFYYFISKNEKESFKKRRLSLKVIHRAQLIYEIKYSFITSVIFAIGGTILIYYWQLGKTKVYIDLHQYSLLWIPLSMMMIFIIHETYYYWLHRWMHHRKVYKWIHKTHHESLNTTAWTSFSFHPTESVLQALPIYAFLFLIPTHLISLVLILIIMTVSSIINHLNSEIYPSSIQYHWLGKWVIGATHHHLHHSQFYTNYGLYFTFWDKWMGTESKDFKKLFMEKTS